MTAHIGTIAMPDTGKMMTIAYETDPGGGGIIIVTVGRIGHDQADATIELGASQTQGLIRFIDRAVDALAQNRPE